MYAASSPAQPDADTGRDPDLPAVLDNPGTVRQIGLFPGEGSDADGDGVMDIDDNCANTARLQMTPVGERATTVDECGCPLDPCKVYDDDRDGVGDCDDRCPGTRSGLKVGSNGCPLPVKDPIRFVLDVKFDFATSNLSEKAVADLDTLRAVLKRYPEITVTLEGHTDAIGSDAYNQALSQSRARVARRYVVEWQPGLAERVQAVGYGETRPVADNRSEVGRAQNRRTVAEIRFDREIIPPNSLEDLLKATPD